MPTPIVNLNVFTNVTSPNVRHCLVPEAVNSFFHAFASSVGEFQIVTRIFIDPKPHRENFDNWIHAINTGLPNIAVEIIATEGLIDGFWRSVKMSEGGYAIQLEHDFVFLKSRICHGLDQIIDEMRRADLNFIRFNKRRNVRFGYDLFVDPEPFTTIPLSRISGRSNNPQMIDVKYYRKLSESIPDIQRLGLEGGLCRYVGGGHLYGGPGWPRTVQHLDGRGVRIKDGLARTAWLIRQRGLSMLQPR